VYELLIEVGFSAAHRLHDYHGKCERLHGHNYRVEFVLQSEALDAGGMVVDFKDAKAIAREVVGRLDHRYLNEMEPFDKLSPTTEHIARHLADELSPRLPRGVRLRSVTCWESDGCAARYVCEGGREA